MPALQVRDFPNDLYETLKAAAARNHRSMAQQTVAYVEQGIALEEQGVDPYAAPRRTRYIDFDTEAERAARIRKRKDLFAQIAANKIELPPDFDPVAIVHEGRRERDRQMSELMGLPFDEEV